MVMRSLRPCKVTISIAVTAYSSLFAKSASLLASPIFSPLKLFALQHSDLIEPLQAGISDTTPGGGPVPKLQRGGKQLYPATGINASSELPPCFHSDESNGHNVIMNGCRALLRAKLERDG